MTIPWWAFPGNKVVCVDTEGLLSPENSYEDERIPERGHIYTIRRVLLPDGETPTLLLREVRNRLRPYHFGVMEYSFKSTRFRPLVSDDDHIEAAMFLGKGLHVKAPEKERA